MDYSQSSSQSSQFSRSQSASFGHSEFSQEAITNIANSLSKKLGKDHTASRVGAGNSRFTYIESWKVIQLANQIFGFNGWSCSIVDISHDYIEESKGRFTVGVTAVVRITLRDGTMHEDVGYGMSENPRKGAAIELAKKEAVSDARKRALRLFGDSLGNCLYDKNHLKRIKTQNGNMGEDILESHVTMPNMQIKDEPNHEEEQENIQKQPLAPLCSMQQGPQNPRGVPPKIIVNNNSPPGVTGNRFQPYPKPMVNGGNNNMNNNGNMNNGNMNNGGNYPPKPIPQMNNNMIANNGMNNRPPGNNFVLKPNGMNMNNNNGNMNNGNPINGNVNRSSPPQVKQEKNSFISPSPMIGHEEDEQFENFDFAAMDQAANIQIATSN